MAAILGRRGHHMVDDRHILLQPERYLIGAGSFAAAAFARNLVAPSVGALFGTLFFPVGGAVYDFLNQSWVDQSSLAKIIKLSLALIAAMGAGFLVTTAFGFSLTLAQCTLLTAGGTLAAYASKYVLQMLETEFAPGPFLLNI